MEIVYLDPKQLKIAPTNVRHDDIPQSELDEMVSSIRKIGLREPIIINRSYEIVSGGIRWRAALQAGLDRIPCVIVDFKDKFEERVTCFIQDDLKHPLTEADKARFVEACIKEDGKTIEEIAAALGKSPDAVHKWLRAQRIPDVVKTDQKSLLKWVKSSSRFKLAAQSVLGTKQFSKPEEAIKIINMLPDRDKPDREAATLRTLEQISKEAHLGLRVDVDYRRMIEASDYDILEVKLPRSLYRSFISKLKAEEIDLWIAVSKLIEKYVNGEVKLA